MQPIDFLKQGARRFPQNTAVFEQATGKRISYATLNQQVEALAAYLQADNQDSPVTVSVLADNSLEMLLVILASYASNSIITPLTPTDVAKNIQYQLDFVNPDFVFYEKKYEKLLSAYQGKRVLINQINQSSTEQNEIKVADVIKQFINHKPLREITDLAKTAAIKFTGGSTGLPKAVQQSYRCLNTMTMSIAEVYQLQAQEKFLICAPLTHGAGTFVLPVLKTGGQLVITNKLPAEQLLNLISEASICSVWLPPTLLVKLVDEQKNKHYQLPTLKNILYGGAPCSPSLQAQTIKHFGPKLGVTYGLTEAPVIISGMPGCASKNPKNHNSAGFIGPMMRMAVALEDGTISEMPNQTGELIASGDLLMSGYLNNPEETAKTIKDGWLYTGDIGYIDERGCVYIKGRSKEMIISGGFNVFPAEVETVYANHPLIKECFVFGKEDEYWGEQVEIIVVLDPSYEPSEEMKIDFTNYGKEYLGSIKTPKKIHFVKELIKNELGKIDKKTMIEMLYQ